MTRTEAVIAPPQPPPDRAAAGYVPSLDGVRALAVLAIIAFHAREDLLPGARIGVDLFFVMSGFLITGILVRELDRSGRIGFRRFYTRRALRLAPALVLLCAVVGLAFWLVPWLTDRDDTLTGTLAAMTYTSSLVTAGGSDLGWMIHTWSLSVEEFFYLAWPLALVLVARHRRPLLPVAGLVVLAVAYRLLGPYVLDWSPERLYYGPDARAEQLLIGCLLAITLREGWLRIRPWQTVVAVLAFAVFAVVPPELAPGLDRGGSSTLVALTAAVLIAGLLQHPDGRLARIAAAPVLIWIGRRSYGIYLWNLPVVGLVVASPLPEASWIPLELMAQVVLTLVIAAISFSLVEQPFLRLKDRYAAGR